MARKVGKKEIDSVLMQAMMAANNVRPQRDRLLQLQRRLQRLLQAATPEAQDRNAKLGELASDVFKVYYIGLEYGARTLTTCIHLALQMRVRITPPDLAFAVMPDEQLHDALLAQQLPPRPTTQGQAVDRVMAAVLAVKLLEEHLLPRCVECLVGGRAPVPGKPSSPHKDEDPVADAAESLANVDLSDASDATAKTGSEPRDAASSSTGGGGGGDVDKALDYLYRANRIASLAVKHLDLAVSALSRFVEPKRLADLTEFCEKRTYISEEGPYPSSD